MSEDLISKQAAIETALRAINDLQAKDPLRDEYITSEMEEIPSAERRGRWTIETIHQYELAYGTTAYEPVYKCSCCGLVTESYLRLDEPIMPDDADFPKWCGNCGARMDGEEE